MELPPEILQRVERVFEYHHATRLTSESVRAHPFHLDLANRPNPYRVFADLPKVALPTTLLDESVATLALLETGIEALPDSQRSGPQNLQTLATWLFMADGLSHKVEEGGKSHWLRSCPSAGNCFPCEIYVAAFAIEGLEAGLYHYNPREFALRRLRGGPESLAVLKRGRPDLEFLKTVPAALLVSTIFWRSAWKFAKRAWRYALHDAGHLVQNLETTGLGLGIETLCRLHLNDSNTRELIGLPPEVPFSDAESVQAMVVWADQATHPLAPAAPADRPPLAAIPRAPLSAQSSSYGSILAVQQDCVAPGAAVREIRPPLTELSPLGTSLQPAYIPQLQEVSGGKPLREVLMHYKLPIDFARQGISRNQFLTINRLAFRGGSFFPIHPDGPHVGVVRPLWLVHDVTGINPGIWYYHPPTDQCFHLREGSFRLETQYVSMEQPPCGNASAVCFFIAHLHELMTQSGPDAYRLAHLEAAIVAQRILLAGGALGLACFTNGAFYDEEARNFLGIQNSGWEIIYQCALGHPLDESTPKLQPQGDDLQWR